MLFRARRTRLARGASANVTGHLTAFTGLEDWKRVSENGQEKINTYMDMNCRPGIPPIHLRELFVYLALRKFTGDALGLFFFQQPLLLCQCFGRLPRLLLALERIRAQGVIEFGEGVFCLHNDSTETRRLRRPERNARKETLWKNINQY